MLLYAVVVIVFMRIYVIVAVYIRLQTISLIQTVDVFDS